MFAFVVSAAAACWPGSAARAADSPDATRLESAHYLLTSQGDASEAREFAAVLEAAWPQFETFFGTAPKLVKNERLRVRFFETAPAMTAAITAGGGVAPDAGGYYCPVAKTAYAYRQPSRWYTRTLLVHEASHQFHLLGVAKGLRTLPPSWFTEGIAEHLSHHTWDGTTLRIGVVPPVSLEDRPARALESASAKDFAIEKILEHPAADRPLAMHLVRFLAAGDGGKPFAAWKDIEKAMNRGSPVKPVALTRAFSNSSALRDRFATWLRSVQQPFANEFVEWDCLADDAVRGRGAAISICRTRGNATTVEASVTPEDPSKRYRVGVLLEWRDPSNYVIAEVESGTRVRVDRLVEGKWVVLHEGPLPDGAGIVPWKLAANRDGDDVSLQIGSAKAYTFASPAGPLGFCLDACAADFRGIKLR